MRRLRYHLACDTWIFTGVKLRHDGESVVT